MIFELIDVTDARKAGIDRTVRMSITGHAITDMDQRYDAVDLKGKQEAVKRLEAYPANVAETLQKESLKGCK